MYIGFRNHKMIVLEYSPRISFYFGDMYGYKGHLNMMIHLQDIDRLISHNWYDKRINSLKKKLKHEQTT